MAPTDVDALAAESVARRRALGRRLAGAGVDAAVIASEPSFAYLTGYATPSWAMRGRPMALAVFVDGSAVAVLSAAEAARVADHAPGLAAEGYAEPRSDGDGTPPDFGCALAERLAAVLARRRPRRLAAELGGAFPPGLAPAALETLRTTLDVELVDSGPLLWPLRACKGDHEVARMRAAADALAAGYRRFAEGARAGMSERELHDLLVRAVAAEDGARLGYAIVAAGARQPLLGPPSGRVWTADELLLVDAGVVHDGYWTDYSRHFAAAPPQPAVRDAYARIVAALAAGRAACRPGACAGDVARAIAAELPRGESAFGRLGHGIGLELTEPPSLHPADATELRPGMTLCIEPIAWFEDVGHLVGEEVLVVTDDGCELLSPPFPPELEVLA